MKTQSIGQGIFPPPSVDFGITVIGISNARMIQISDVSSNLMKTSGLWPHAKQRAPGISGSTNALHHAHSIFPVPIVVLHGLVDVYRFIGLKVTADKGQIGLCALAQRCLERSCPFSLFGKNQAARCLKVESVNRVHMSTNLVAHPLETCVSPSVVFVAVHNQTRGLGDHDQLVGLHKYVQGAIFRHMGGITTLGPAHVE